MVRAIEELSTAYTKIYNEYLSDLNSLAEKPENKSDVYLFKEYKPLIINYLYIKNMCDPNVDADDNVPKV